MIAASVLIVDDEPGIREQLAAILRDEGCTVTAAADGEEALERAGREPFDLVLLDVWLPGIDGLAVLARLRAVGHRAPVVMISGHASEKLASRAMSDGAVDFLDKPLALERVLVTVRNALRQDRLARRLALVEGADEPTLGGDSAAVGVLRDQLARVAPTDARVLLTGANGSGKEVAARILHRSSRRADGPFVPVNCAAIPAELIESELFGHVRGAFTGAVEARRGTFELADGGTLFLDEIGDMSPAAQAKLLRVLETGRFLRVGGEREVAVDVRVIAATNKDLSGEIEAGRFRQDLFFRIAVVTVRVPSLGERRDDILPLAREFARTLARRHGWSLKEFHPAAEEALRSYSWPGNVRELRNVVERALIMAPGEFIGIEHLGLRPVASGAVIVDGLTLREARTHFERDFISRAVAAHGGNLSRAARALGVERSYLYRKLEALGLRVR